MVLHRSEGRDTTQCEEVGLVRAGMHHSGLLSLSRKLWGGGGASTGRDSTVYPVLSASRLVGVVTGVSGGEQGAAWASVPPHTSHPPVRPPSHRRSLHTPNTATTALWSGDM
ncbi:hypothetical protein Pcinc_032174 [Petrolisthes cinctipes]|uniref:Uncharacterized protein n=1 Tax=Petrolisthes cinctipes TaxID=88211 RepID=A0AAE1K1X9_PETCI|nr:hypothetical protein Pcinc_032174 [Petrolisthes cinctipes]